MAFDLIDFTDHYKSQFFEFYLDPEVWSAFETAHPLVWHKIRFNEDNRSTIPTQRGIYAFSVEHHPSKLPNHSYILYVGISGNTSASNLRRRYGQYLQYRTTGKGRPAVTYMLRKWPEDLFFSYCPLPDPTINLARLETSLLGTLNPPINKKDFPAKIAAARKAKF